MSAVAPVLGAAASPRENVNIIYPRMIVNTLRVKAAGPNLTLRSLHYASPKPLTDSDLARHAAESRKRSA
jgi:hypothetical protein